VGAKRSVRGVLRALAAARPPDHCLGAVKGSIHGAIQASQQHAQCQVRLDWLPSQNVCRCQWEYQQAVTAALQGVLHMHCLVGYWYASTVTVLLASS
jgi:hypothetical protein